jgi:hypothetical protein
MATHVIRAYVHTLLYLLLVCTATNTHLFSRTCFLRGVLALVNESRWLGFPSALERETTNRLGETA